MNTSNAIVNGIDQARIYTDLSGLESLKGQAKCNSAGAAKVVARQFEALFVQMMLKSMREATPQNGMFDSNQSRTYQDLFDKQIAMDIAQRGNLGIADLVLSQTAPNTKGQGVGGAAGKAGADMTFNPRYFTGARPNPFDSSPASTMRSVSAAKASTAASVDAVGTAAGPLPDRLDSAEDFVKRLAPYAEQAGRQLGVSPDLLLAQAALETGWGQHMIRNSAGGNSYNLFGIKAGTGWQGNTVTVSTLEYDGGTAQKTTAAFRAYGSYAQSFQDYVDFVRSHPRYAQALHNAGDPGAYIGALHRAGYATDPDYPAKVLGLMRNEVQELKVAQARVLTDG
jgi:flagellar protein FlgJ